MSEITNQAELSPPPVDLAALEARCWGNLDLVDRVLTKFTGQVDADLAEFERAIADQDAIKAAQLAHRIKGIAGSVEARSLYDDATQAEKCALNNGIAELPDYLNRMQNDRVKVSQFIGRTK